MSTNRVLNYKAVETVTKAGKQLLLGAATETQLWKRLDVGITETSMVKFKAAVQESPKALPAETAKVIWREGEHTSDDPTNHFTAVLFDDDDKYLGTEHFDRRE